MDSKRRIDCIRRDFPAMSAHFAHTLDDLAEKYLKIQFIQIDELQGTLSPEDLMLLKASRANVLVYDGLTYEYSNFKEPLYYYISTSSVDGKIAMDEIIVNGDTGEYTHQKLANEIEEAPEDGEAYARKDGEWVKLSPQALAYSFLSGPLNQETIKVEDLTRFNILLNPAEVRMDQQYNLEADSYIWFVSLKEIEYIAHAGGLEIDYGQMSNITSSYDGQEQTWYCYRTTYPLLSGVWNLIIKFKE